MAKKKVVTTEDGVPVTESSGSPETDEEKGTAIAEANVKKAGGHIAAPAAGTKDEPPSSYKQKTSGSDPTQPAPESTWQQLADAQANQYLSATQNLAPLTTGSTISNIDSQMASGAEAMLGQSGGGAMDAWLKQQGSAAAAQYAPLQAAVGQEETAEQNAEKLEAGGIKNMGTAEASMIQVAPYQQLLSSLAADVPYKLLGGAYGSYDIPGILGKNVPSGVETALNNLGVSTKGLTSNGVPTLPPVAGSTPSATPTPESTTSSLTQ